MSMLKFYLDFHMVLSLSWLALRGGEKEDIYRRYIGFKFTTSIHSPLLYKSTNIFLAKLYEVRWGKS